MQNPHEIAKHCWRREKNKKPSGKPKILKKTKENQQNIRKNKKTKFLKVSDPPLDMGFVFLVFFGFFGFLEGFFGFVKTFGKTKQKQAHIQGWV